MLLRGVAGPGARDACPESPGERESSRGTCQVGTGERAAVSPAHRPARAPGKRPLREGESGRSALGAEARSYERGAGLLPDSAGLTFDCWLYRGAVDAARRQLDTAQLELLIE